MARVSPWPSVAAAALLLAVVPAAALPGSRVGPGNGRSQPPQCTSASHERLLLRDGRDVCAPTLSSSGRPTAVGFMATQCPSVGQVYRIDTVGKADRCIIQGQGSSE